jgi:predicted Fe-Mo cluster-binding NifX family protein
MIVCVTADGGDWAAKVDPAFGRSAFFLFIDTETEAIETVANEPGAHGAGVQAAQTVTEHGAGAVITGRVGPNAFQGLKAAGVDVFTGVTGSVRQAFDAYVDGTLTRTDIPTGRAHQGGRR